MDVIFKFGEHYYASGDSSVWWQFGVTVIGAFLGFGFALIIYYKNINRATKEEKIRLSIEHTNRLKYHSLLIDNLINNIKIQMRLLDEYMKNQNDDFLNVLRPRRIVTSDFKRLLYINKDVFQSINYIKGEDKEWISDLGKLHSTVDYVEESLAEMERIGSLHEIECYQKNLEIKNKIDLIPDKLAVVAMNKKNELGDLRWKDDVFQFTNKSIGKYGVLVDKKADLRTINNEFLKPLLEEIIEKYQRESFSVEILSLAKSSRMNICEIEAKSKNMIGLVDQIKIEFEKSLDKVISCNKKFD